MVKKVGKVEKIIGAIIREGAPIVAGIHKGRKEEERLRKEADLSEKYYSEVNELINAPTPPNMLEIEKHNHNDKECSTCGNPPKIEFLRTNKFQPLPHDVTTEKDPHYNYTVKEISKHLALLQNHFTDYRCPNCIEKHLMIIEGLGEEGVPMTPDSEEREKFQKVIQWAKSAAGRKDFDRLLQESRDARLLITGQEHSSDEFEHSS